MSENATATQEQSAQTDQTETSDEQTGSEQQASGEQLSEKKSDGKQTEAQKEMQKFVKELKLKVNGKEVSKKIDWNDEASLIKEFQLAEANKMGMQKASEYEKSFQQFIQNLQQNPKNVLKQLGQDPDKMLEAWVNEKLQEMEKSPEVKEREAALRKAEEAENKAKKLEEKIQQREFLELKRQETEKFEHQMGDFFNKYPNAPEEFKDEIRAKAINVMQKYLEEIPELELKDVLPIVEEQYFDRFNKMVETAPLALVEKLFGKKAIDKMRLENIKKVQDAQINNLNKGSTSVVTPAQKAKGSEQLVSSKNFFRNLK
jgi:hypothetical protein